MDKTQIIKMYQYKAIVVRVVDGDTVVLNIDLGFNVCMNESCRLAGIDTPELTSTNSEEKAKAVVAKKFLAKILQEGKEVTINSKALDKYRRPLVEILVSGMSISVNQKMIDSGLAKKYGIRHQISEAMNGN
jgi:micrococcal nuclease